jgi:hypothetical protein
VAVAKSALFRYRMAPCTGEKRLKGRCAERWLSEVTDRLARRVVRGLGRHIGPSEIEAKRSYQISSKSFGIEAGTNQSNPFGPHGFDISPLARWFSLARLG